MPASLGNTKSAKAEINIRAVIVSFSQGNSTEEQKQTQPIDTVDPSLTPRLVPQPIPGSTPK